MQQTHTYGTSDMNADTQAAPQTERASSANTLAIPGINSTQAIARFSGDESRYLYWLTEFVSHGPAAATQIRQAIDNGSRDTAIKLTHALKGRTGMLGMTELHSIAQSLEQCLKNSEPTLLWIDELQSTTVEMCEDISSALGPFED